MISRHFYKLAILFFSVLLYFLTADYIAHKKAYERKQTRDVEIVKTNCSRKGGETVDINDNGTRAFVEVLGGSCSDLVVGQKMKVLHSTYNNKYYWNTEPLTRILWFAYPLIGGLMIYLFVLDRRSKTKEGK